MHGDVYFMDVQMEDGCLSVFKQFSQFFSVKALDHFNVVLVELLVGVEVGYRHASGFCCLCFNEDSAFFSVKDLRLEQVGQWQ